MADQENSLCIQSKDFVFASVFTRNLTKKYFVHPSYYLRKGRVKQMGSTNSSIKEAK